ncbi:MAG TPA: 2-phospho-L-lactate guanylyltransferase [Ardenticatenaceae bacterium]|jgi:2-phospho-L-lactate guanylyltransferase
MWVLIPAKSANRAKSRLASLVSEEARAVLARTLLARVLTVVTHCPAISNAVVISDDLGLRTIARLFGYHAIPDPGPEPDLNAALEAGRRYAVERGAEAVLVLPTDLPWLTKEALNAFMERVGQEERVVGIARDREGLGTNALFQRPAHAIPFRFGLGSARCHVALAEKAGLPVVEWDDPTFAFDLDSPEDWQRLVA